MLSFVEQLVRLREKIAKTTMKCEACGEILQVIDIEQHLKEKHFE